MTSKALIAGAAIAGLMSGLAITAQGATSHTKAGVSLEMGKKKADTDKHTCKGENSCKGKTSCKGKGGCATDGSKPAESPAK